MPSPNKKKLKSAKKIALTGILFATALILSFVEHSIPPLFPAIPGIRMGLSNMMVLYALFFLSWRQAAAIAGLKSLFVLFTRGVMAGLLSLSGGFLSLLVMLILKGIFRENISLLLLSVCGAIAHNLGQYMIFTLIYSPFVLWAYLPLLVLGGIGAGLVTAYLLKVILPAFKRLDFHKE